MGRLVINGTEIYELDEDCLKEKYKNKRIKECAGKKGFGTAQQNNTAEKSFVSVKESNNLKNCY